MVSLGALNRLTYDVFDVASAATNATTVTLTITKPDGVQVAPSVTNPPAITGHYIYDYPTTLGGQHVAHWSTAGPVTTGDEEFWVEPVPGIAIPPFASPDELRLWTGAAVADLSEDKAWLVLHAVSGDIRSAAGWSITEETPTFILDVPRGRDLWLPTLRLTAVASVTVDGALIPAANYGFTPQGRIRRTDSCWWTGTWGPQTVVVVATHGWPAGQVPGAVKSLCLEHATRRLDTPDGVPKSLRIDDYMESPTGISLGTGRIEADPRVPRLPVVA